MLKFRQKHQFGVVTLLTSIVVLITLTLAVAYATRVGLFDIRMAANELRYKEAFSIADGGLEFATEQFSNNITPLSGNYIYDPDGDGVADAIPNPYMTNFNINGGVAANTQARFTATVTQQTVSGVTVFNISSTGQSIDRSGAATVSKQIVIRGLTGGQKPDTPVIADGGMNVTGNMHIVANPNGAENCVQGCAVSVWTNGAVAAGNSISTCHMQGYSGGQCPNPALDPTNSQITNGADTGLDIVQNDPYTNASPAGNFPPDLFEYLFGVPYTEWASIKSMKTNTDAQTDCSHMGATSKGLHWVDSCSLNANTVVGSLTNPVILVVHNDAFNSGGGAEVNGIVFVFDDTPGTAPAVDGPDPGGGSIINGSLMSNTPFNGGGSGTFAVVYDPTLLDNIINNSGSEYRTIATVPGSWRDF